MQKITIYYVIPEDAEVKNIELVDLTSFKESFYNDRQELQFSAQDILSSKVLKELMSAKVQKITMDKTDADSVSHTIDFEYYPAFEKITQDYKGAKISTSFQSMYVYNS